MFADTTLVWDLQRANQIARSFSTSLDPEAIARLAADGLVEHFDCSFVRIWLVEPGDKMLRLIASSGLYTRTDGSFSRIPIGSFKIGKIAENRVSLLSNNLAAESWLRYPEWAIANNLRSFAGYPLTNSNKVIGVLGVFNQNPMQPEFLEILLSFCTTLTVALEMASKYQKQKQDRQAIAPKITLPNLSLSDSLSYILGQTNLTVIGTEKSIDLSQIQVFLKVGEILKQLNCSYCRLTYEPDSVSLEAIAATLPAICHDAKDFQRSVFGNLFEIVSYFGGVLNIQTEPNLKAIKVLLKFSSAAKLASELSVSIQCRLPLLQKGLTELAYQAGLRVSQTVQPHIPLISDRTSLIETSDFLIWVDRNSNTIPSQAKAQIDLSVTSEQLREVVETVMKGGNWGLENCIQEQQKLSNREQKIISLLAAGLRDREIAEQLYISDSTVKFHVNNILNKLQAKTRLQALYNLMIINGLEI
ncbi:MAG: LuxR C-terminal-related transcriptional regulator [Prochloraceae cyanobacterium]|nr:LuxR C-terminal-related transcriptional regulator [Prochloraceae cyanobacterium]